MPIKRPDAIRLVLVLVLSCAAITTPIALAGKADHRGAGHRLQSARSAAIYRRSMSDTRPTGNAGSTDNSGSPGLPSPRAHASIIGGAVAQTGSFPSLAYIVDFQGRFAYQCTGTVVAPSLVLTAGHCVENMQSGAAFSPSGFRVVTGAVDPLLPGDTVSTVLGVIVYPGLQRRVDKGDAALLVLSTPIAAPPIELARANRLVAGVPATTVGW